MTRLASLAVVLVLAVGCGQSSSVTVSTTDEPVAATPAAFNADEAPTVAFDVPDMMCEFSCVPTVRDALAKQPGVKDVKVDLETKRATVAVEEDQFDADAAIAALVDLQYKNTKLATAGTKAEADGEQPAEAEPATADAGEKKAKS